MRVVVVGDILLDVDIAGEAEKLSPDGPVPVLSVGRTVRRAGGAGLVALLLARDGVEVTLVTALASDDGATTLRKLLDDENDRSTAGLRVVAGVSPTATPVKTRVRAGDQVVVRLDEGGGAAAPEVSSDMLEALTGADAVIVADYGRGLTSDERVRSAVAREAERVPVVWDPHPRGAHPVPGAVVTPNLGEARSAADVADTGVASP